MIIIQSINNNQLLSVVFKFKTFFTQSFYKHLGR